MSATIPPSLYSPCYPLFSPFAGVAQPVPKVRDRAAGPHPVVVRAGGAAQPRPHGPRLLARGEDDAQQAQAGHQVQTEEGRINNRVFHWVAWSVVLINRVLCLVYKNVWLGFQSLCVHCAGHFFQSWRPARMQSIPTNMPHLIHDPVHLIGNVTRLASLSYFWQVLGQMTFS